MMRLALLMFLFAAPFAAAQERITKPVKMIIGFAPGGSVDLVGHYNAELMGGQVSAGISGIADAADFHRAGKLRIVAVSGAERSRALPDVPTFRELGVPMDLSLWYGVFAPAGTPELTERFVSLGLDPAADFARWRPIVQQAGFKLD